MVGWFLGEARMSRARSLVVQLVQEAQSKVGLGTAKIGKEAGRAR